MSAISSDRPAKQISAYTDCHICKSKLIIICPRCTEVNTVKNETKQRKHHVACSLAIQVAIIAIFLALLFGPSFINTCTCTCIHACVSPEDCYATGRGLKVAVVGKRASAVLYAMDHRQNAYTEEVDNVTCEVLYESTGEKIECGANRTRWNEYEISYQVTNLGTHQVHIKVDGEHIKDSPFTVTVIKKFGTPIKIISGLKEPSSVAVNQRGDILVAESSEDCISIFSPTGEKLGSFGSYDSGLSQPYGIGVDDDGNILVTDCSRLLKFSSELKFITSAGRNGNDHLQYYIPRGVAISPITKKIAVTNWRKHQVNIFNLDLTLNSSIGSQGDGDVQFQYPSDVAFDSAGNLYVADTLNYRIQEFTPEGKFLGQVGRIRQGGKLNGPRGICIGSDDTVYVADYSNHRVLVFSHIGKFLTSFGSKGSGPGQFKHPQGITVDKNGLIYVTDTENNRIQIF